MPSLLKERHYSDTLVPKCLQPKQTLLVEFGLLWLLAYSGLELRRAPRLLMGDGETAIAVVREACLHPEAARFLYPAQHFALIDNDCVPVTLFEVQDRERERKERMVFPATNNRPGTHQRKRGEILSIPFRKTPESKEREGKGRGRRGD